MPFDASVISQIADGQADIPGSIQKGYQLKDLINTQQANGLRLKDLQTEQKEAGQIKELGKKYDLSTREGQMGFVGEATKVNPQTGMKLQSELSSIEGGKLENDMKRLQLMSSKQDAVVGSLGTISSSLDTLKAQGATPAMLDAKAQEYATAEMKKLSAQHPELKETIAQFASQPITYQSVHDAFATSQKGKAQLEAHMKEFQQKNFQSEIDHRKVEEKQGQERIEIDRKKLEVQKANAAQFGGDNGDLLAALAERGVSLPAGFRSKAQQVALLNGLRERNAGKSPDEIAELIAKGQLGFKAESKETQTAAGIAGRVAVGEEELIDFAPKALAISDKVARGNFKPFNKLKQVGLENISDPDLKELYGRTNAILNAYDVVAARGGTDKDKRAENRKNLETADSPAAYRRAVETMMDEARIAKGAARKAEGRPVEPQKEAPKAMPTATGPDGKKVQWNGTAWVPVG